MPKKLYMLTRPQTKPCTHLGVRRIPATGGLPERIERVAVSFVPGKAAEVDADLDMSGPIEAGFVTEIGGHSDKPMKVKVGAMTATVDPGEDGELNTEDDKVTISPTDPEEEPEEEEPEEEPEDEEDEDDQEEYYQLDDGRFQCAICEREGNEKILKTEEGMINHVADKHS